jgi:hypothetical protein
MNCEWQGLLALKMFLARMFSTHAKQTVCLHGWKPTEAGTSFLQIMHSSSPSFSFVATFATALPWPQTLAVQTEVPAIPAVFSVAEGITALL